LVLLHTVIARARRQALHQFGIVMNLLLNAIYYQQQQQFLLILVDALEDVVGFTFLN
jgi:hypothetical protein